MDTESVGRACHSADSGRLGIRRPRSFCRHGGAPHRDRVAGPGQIPGVAPATNLPIGATLLVNPGQVNKGQSVSVSTTATGGNPSPTYTYSYFGFPAGCTGYNTQSFSCTPTETGTFSVYVTVTDMNDNTTNSNNVGLVVSSSSGNGGNGGGGNNSSNPFSGLLSGFSGVLSLLLIAGIVGFVTWILLIVGVWIIAIVLMRRLPKRGAVSTAASAATMKCANCSAAIPAGSKFCPECGTSQALKTP